MRVAIVVPGLTTPGGVPTVARLLGAALNQRGRYHTTFISIATSSRDSSSVRLLSPRSWGRPLRVVAGRSEEGDFLHVGALLAELEPLRYRPRKVLTDLLDSFDVVQVVAGIPAWALVATASSRPVFLYVASVASLERKRRLQQEVFPWRRWMTMVTSALERSALREVARVFVMNRSMRDVVASVVPPSRVVLAPPGIDTERFVPTAYNPNGPLLWIARLADPRKNLSLMLHSYKRVKQGLPAAPRLIICGSGLPRREDGELAKRLGIDTSLQIRSNVPPAELPSLYQQASVFVMSSDEEGFGLVALEAMASGLPVVSTRCWGTEMTVRHGENGLLTPVGDASALADAITWLLERPALRAQMGRRGRELATQMFALGVAAQPFFHAYDELVATSSGDRDVIT